ncbi:unnamed protein product [marine sediment metagenome]|uniref:Uncharacterized protein n=1 Tax=marine sediment metagenome TaxID=412755 RepID=X1FF48_9ZZZZ
MGEEETLLGKLGKLISSLILLGVSSSWFVFTIWGIATWSIDTASFVSNRITIILLYIPLFIGMFILFIIVMTIGSAAIKGKKKEEDKEKEDFSWVPDKTKEKFSKTIGKEFLKFIEKENLFHWNANLFVVCSSSGLYG